MEGYLKFFEMSSSILNLFYLLAKKFFLCICMNGPGLFLIKNLMFKFEATGKACRSKINFSYLQVIFF